MTRQSMGFWAGAVFVAGRVVAGVAGTPTDGGEGCGPEGVFGAVRH